MLFVLLRPEMLCRMQPSTATPDITDRLGRNSVLRSYGFAQQHASSPQRFAGIGAGSQLEYLSRLKTCELLSLGALRLEALLDDSRFVATDLA